LLAFVSTICLDPQPVCGTWSFFQDLAFVSIRYIDPRGLLHHIFRRIRKLFFPMYHMYPNRCDLYLEPNLYPGPAM